MAKNSSKNDVAVPALGFVGMLRWAWTQLTSMRTALFLLLLLAVAAVPGSLFPQRSVNPEQVATYLTNRPTAGEWLDRFQLFDVYSSVWFSSIYLLLFISLIGCILPRVKKHAKALRTPPPRTPSRLDRLPQNGTIEIQSASESGLSDDDVVQQAAKLLKKRGYRSEARPKRGKPVGRRRTRLHPRNRQSPVPHLAGRAPGLGGHRRRLRIQRTACPGRGGDLCELPGFLRLVQARNHVQGRLA